MVPKTVLVFQTSKKQTSLLPLWYSSQNLIKESMATSLYLKLKMNNCDNFFPSNVIEWNKLDNNIRNSKSISAFKRQILKFIRPSLNSTFDVYNPYGIKLLKRVWMSHLHQHKFRCNLHHSIDQFFN